MGIKTQGEFSFSLNFLSRPVGGTSKLCSETQFLTVEVLGLGAEIPFWDAFVFK